MKRRLVITVCPREFGTVALAVTRGGPPERMDAARIAHHLEASLAERGLADRVRIMHGCAGGCAGEGPNVSVACYPLAAPGERPDNVAIGWKTYVASLDSLDCLARIIDENLGDEPAPPRGPLVARRQGGSRTPLTRGASRRPGARCGGARTPRRRGR
jgi:hypothetical protein